MKTAIMVLFLGVLVIASFNIPAIADQSVMWYWDNDGDGYGGPAISVESDSQPFGYVVDNTDCEDFNGNIHPGAIEICGDNIDQDCSGADTLCEYDPALAFQIQKLYIGYLGRAADKAGLNYWVNEIATGVLTMEQLRANLTNGQPEYTDIYGGLTRSQLVSQIYRNLFDREPDADGLNYWVSGGGSTVNADQLIVAFFNAAAPSDQLVLDNKTTEAMKETQAIEAHNSITDYSGPSTCIGCHQQEATEMLDSLHMKWSGPTPDLSNTDGEEFGKGVNGINTFCTYAMSSKAACFSCHVRADGNAPDPVQAEDVDCLMCHSDTYQRKFISDPENTETVTNVLGQSKTYVFGKVDTQGNYTIVPDYDKMPEGTTMVSVARAAHLPTNDSCLRCHATAGGGDWTKRGDMGKNSANATVEQDVHLAKDGANLSCVDCHSALNHKIAGRGIDLRQTEAAAPTCSSCHTKTPHSSTILNRHAQGQVSCQVCHIRTYAKGGATEMSRDWNQPTWNPAFCSGQGGFVGHEVKEANVKPDYVWFDGTSYVYNVGETIQPDKNSILHMAKANGAPFDGRSYIVPIKRHFSNMPFDVGSGRIIPPAIMWMFMTGDFDQAVQKGLEEQAAKGRAGDYTGTYAMYQADAEMLITHGVEPKEKAPSCIECHNNSGSTPDGSGMLPFNALGYHQVPDAVRSCTLCHEQKSESWEPMHNRHRQEISCSSCHTPEPTGVKQGVCSSCHGNKSWSSSEGHKEHVVEKGYDCIRCHTFS